MTRRLCLRHTTCFLWFLLHCLSLSKGGVIRPLPDLPTVNYSRPGDFNIAAMFAVHLADPKALCSDVVNQLSILQRLESIVYAVEEINNRSDLLPNVTLGFTILDDCYNELVALARSLHFIQRDTKNTSKVYSLDAQESLPALSAFAVIGTEGSPRTAEIAAVLTLFKVPSLSYMSSSTVLNNKHKFAYFSRTVPSDNMQAKAIVDVLRSFGWTYVSMLYADSVYGREGLLSIQTYLEKFPGYCLGLSQILKDSFQEKDYEDTVKKLSENGDARVVVLFTEENQAFQLFRVLQRHNLQGHYTFVASDFMSINIDIFKDVMDVVDGTITVSFQSTSVDRFERYFRHLSLRKGSRNPWLGEYVSNLFSCSLVSGFNACDLDREIVTSELYHPDISLSLSMNAVYATAHALDAVLRNCTLDDVQQCVKPQVFLDTLRSVHFVGEGANVSFEPSGNGQTNYYIQNLVADNGSFVFRTVGLWNTATQSFSYFKKDQVRWNPDLKATSWKPSYKHPVSVCKQPCGPGQWAVPAENTCCFDCKACQKNERTVIDPKLKLPICQQCPTDDSFTWPDDETRTRCQLISPSYLDTRTLEGGLVFTLDVAVFLLTCLTTILFIRKGHCRLIKSSSKELCVILLVGHLFTCVLIVAFVIWPTNATCIITYAGFHVSFTLSYGPLLVKTSRVYRIFVTGRRTTKIPRFVSSRSQVAIAISIILVQLLLTCVTVALNRPEAMTSMPDKNEKYVKRHCSVPRYGFVALLAFNILLMALCAGHAFKVMKLPANFNEAKFITFSIYFTIMLWVSFIPTYFTANKGHMTQELSLAVTLLFNVLFWQVFLFLPKLYAVYFLSEKEMNIRDQKYSSSLRNDYPQ